MTLVIKETKDKITVTAIVFWFIKVKRVYNRVLGFHGEEWYCAKPLQSVTSEEFASMTDEELIWGRK